MTSRASTSAGVASIALGRRQLRLELRVDEPLERDRVELLALLVDDRLLGLRLRVGQAPGDVLAADAALGLVQPPRLDREAVAELVLGDALSVDAADRREMVVVPGQPGGGQEEEDRGGDDQAEAQVEVEVPSVLALPRGTVVALDDGLGSKGHVVEVVL